MDIKHDDEGFDDVKLDVIDVKDRLLIVANCPGATALKVYLKANKQMVIVGKKISNKTRRNVNRVRAPEADSILFGESFVRNPFNEVKNIILNERKAGVFQRTIQLPDSIQSENSVQFNQDENHGIVKIEVLKRAELLKVKEGKNDCNTKEENHTTYPDSQDVIIEPSS